MRNSLRWIACGWILSCGASMALAQTNAELLEAIRSLRDRVEQLEQQDTAANKASLLEALKEYEGESGMRVYWDKGLRLDSHNDWFQLKIGGRVMFDMGYTSGDDHSEMENQEDWAEMRRLRLYMSGKIYRNVGYKVQLDFADGSLDTKDAYVEIYSKGIPFVQSVVDSVRAGHFKEPFSLEELTSSKYITFAERAAAVGTFAPSRNPGIQIAKYWKACRAGYQLGVFREADDSESVSDGGYNLTGRAFWAPLQAEDGARVIHLGTAYSMRHYGSDEGTLRNRTRGEQHVGNRFLDTADLPAEDVDLFGAEAAWVHGPFSLQGEFIASSIDMRSGQGYQDACLRGAYVQASYFLTGEHRVYKKGTFSRVKPKQDFTPDGGTGAVELAARYSYLDMTDGNFNSFTEGRAGQLDALTVGVNWYLNPNTRIMVNYVRSCWDVEPNTADATAAWDEAVDTVIVRFQIDF